MVRCNTGACLLAAAAAVAFTASGTSQTRALTITGVNVVDVADRRIVPNATVSVSGDTITSVTPAGAAPAGAEVVDGRGTRCSSRILWLTSPAFDAFERSCARDGSWTGKRSMGSWRR